MRIGIITQPLANNYGGILQNWALQQVLKKMGHEPYTIRILYRAKDRLWAFRWLIHDLRSLLSIFKGKKVSFINPISYYINYQRSLRPKCTFKEFVSNHINRTRMYDICPKRAISDYKFDALITGSDQVWRPISNPHIEDEFLGFTQWKNIRKIAYAASFGTSEWEYPPNLEVKCRELAQKLDAVSVREISGIELCKNHFDVNATWVLDPTLLLTRADYEPFCQPGKIQEPYIFSYILDENPELQKRIEDEAKRRKCKLVTKSVDNAVNENDTIEGWLSLIANAETVFTDSFHGTIFSIIFQRDFITFVNKNRGSARFDTLREKLNISDWIIDYTDEFPLGKIAYNEINNTIKQIRDKSFEWLKDALDSRIDH